MNADLDMEEAARLLERSRDLLLIHRASTPGLTYFIGAHAKDATALRNMARIARENTRFTNERLFA